MTNEKNKQNQLKHEVIVIYRPAIGLDQKVTTQNGTIW